MLIHYYCVHSCYIDLWVHTSMVSTRSSPEGSRWRWKRRPTRRDQLWSITKVKMANRKCQILRLVEYATLAVQTFGTGYILCLSTYLGEVALNWRSPKYILTDMLVDISSYTVSGSLLGQITYCLRMFPVTGMYMSNSTLWILLLYYKGVDAQDQHVGQLHRDLYGDGTSTPTPLEISTAMKKAIESF